MIYYNNSLNNYYSEQGYITSNNLEAAVKDLHEVGNRRIFENIYSRIEEYFEEGEN